MLAVAILLLQSYHLKAETLADSTGLPGDHFSLEGALELFKEAASPEEFEQLLNQEDKNVNNLDLNEDGEVDYIRVVDYMEGEVHAIVLQVPVNDAESQDIAVIEIEKTGDETALLQIIGDEDIYPENTYVEPFEEGAEPGGKGGPNPDYVTRGLVVNVWVWPSVRFIYRPSYRPWVSPWRWRSYPRWWSPWRPRTWRVHYNACSLYRPRYRAVTTHRVTHARRIYTPRRASSVVVRTRTTTIRRNNAGAARVKTTRTNTAVRSKNGNKVAGQKKTTVTRTNRGVKKTTTTRGVKKNSNGARSGVKKTTTRKRKH